MAWTSKAFEWRRLPDSKTWHFFIKSKSLCGRAESNGTFDFVDTKPDKSETNNVCKTCLKNLSMIKNRINEVG